MKIFTIAILGLIFLSFTNFTKTPDPNSTLLDLFKKYDEYNLRTSPENATYQGDHRYDDQLSDYSEESNRSYYDTTRASQLI